MKTQIARVLILIAFILSAIVPLANARTAASIAKPSDGYVSPQRFINANGTLNLDGNFHGTLDLKGWDVQIDPQRGPLFSSKMNANNAPATSTPHNWSAIGYGGGAIDGNVEGIVVVGTDVYVVGDFTDAANIPEADYIAKWNGSTWSALGSNGYGNGAINTGIISIAVIGSNIYVSGYFENVNNNGTVLNAADYVAKWDGTNWSALGNNGADDGSLNKYVTAMVASGTTLYVGGQFTDVNNGGATILTADYIAKWNGTDWSALGSNGSGNGAIGANSDIFALIANGTTLYVGGHFSDVANIPEADNVAKWDGAWSAMGHNGASNGAIVGTVYSLAVSGSNVYVGGQFVDVNNKGSVLNAADYIAKWNGTNWSALGDNGSGDGSLSGIVNCIAISGTDVYVGGSFKNVNNAGTVLTAADYIAKWDGSNWSALGDNGAGDGAIPGKMDPSIMVIAFQGSHVLVGGYFYDVNDGSAQLPQADFLAQWNGSHWSTLGTEANGALVNGYNSSEVRAIAMIGTDLYVAGRFLNVSNKGVNIPEADFVVKWDGLNWSALGSDGAGDGALRFNVDALAVIGTDLYVGGEFWNVAKIPAADYIAKWDGSNWSALGNNGAGNGSIGGTDSYVTALAVSGTDLYVGGGFTDVKDGSSTIDAADNIAKWDGSHWIAVGDDGSGGGSLNGSVSAIAVSGANVYVGGWFTDVKDHTAGTLHNADYIAKWDGSQWSALSSNGAGNGSLNNGIRALALHGSDVYVGGDFTNVNDNGTSLTAADYIVKWDGSHWFALGSNGAGNGSLNWAPSAILVNGKNVYVGGSFQDVNNNGKVLTAADYIANWDGSNWSALTSGVDTQAGALNNNVNALYLNGLDLIVGGEFANVKNFGTTVIKEADYLASFDTRYRRNYLPVTLRN